MHDGPPTHAHHLKKTQIKSTKRPNTRHNPKSTNQKQVLGTDDKLWVASGEGSGHVTRNVRLALSVVDLVEVRFGVGLFRVCSLALGLCVLAYLPTNDDNTHQNQTHNNTTTALRSLGRAPFCRQLPVGLHAADHRARGTFVCV